MTPLEIDIALWYRCRPGDYGKGHGDHNYGAPAVQAVLKEFVEAGLLALSPAGSEAVYYGTNALEVYVEALCAVPLPVQQWIIPSRDHQ